ncbi:MAG: Jag N-terminal domain-containing protein [Deltaproteobacteria bacterium]|nr:Jag N-terminal domain-containing protein [Deltaproteobacteria bacterium]
MEFEGRTTEEAIENASKYLDLPVEDLDIDIIEPGSAGIFGLVGTKKAKIKVSYTPQDHVEEDDETMRELASFARAAGLPEAEEEEEEEVEEEGEEEEEEEILEEAVAPEEAQAGERGAGIRPPEPKIESGPPTPEQEEEMRVAREALETILELMPMETRITAQRMDGNVTLNIEGDNSGLLIGRRGKTLDAIQFIVNKIVNKSLERKVRVVVDSERYRRRRRESLTQLALRMAEKANRIQNPATTNPMNPGDRRIVHLTLKDDQELDTRSRGEGLMKKVVIIPRK